MARKRNHNEASNKRTVVRFPVFREVGLKKDGTARWQNNDSNKVFRYMRHRNAGMYLLPAAIQHGDTDPMVNLMKITVRKPTPLISYPFAFISFA